MSKVPFCNIHIPNWDKVRNYLKLSEKAQLSNFGPCYDLLCERLRKYLDLSDDKEILIVSSGHTALMAAVSIFSKGDVLTPAFTFPSTYQSVNLQKGRRIHFTDVNHHGYLDKKILQHEYDDFVDTILAVCPLSMIPDLEGLEQWCIQYNRNLIIDGAACFGTPGIYNYGNAFCLSFHATKSFPVGECGALIIDKEYASQAKSYIFFGMNEDRQVVRDGLNGKVSEYTCAIALALFDEIELDLELRRANVKLFKQLLPIEIWSRPEVDQQVYQSFPIFHKNANSIREELLPDFEVKQYYKPAVPFHISKGLFESNICLPCHPDVTERDIINMCNIIKKY